ncbi:hypothetical protein Gohar_011882 [Gossypium harknessii]|uniref:Uncharacterized protein n=1 Tax=Gossypium harknessii TaxID=34285 RepID=A0A7J9GVB2_9ROSI|nr:hypothetical protein [Gossypium harknessii]
MNSKTQSKKIFTNGMIRSRSQKIESKKIVKKIITNWIIRFQLGFSFYLQMKNLLRSI